GLTMGIHTRIDDRVQDMIDTAEVGNLYVNRNQIGAVVGSQPFGGEGLSGTGPKAGGPHYLRRFRRMADAAEPESASTLQAAGAEKALQSLDASSWAARADRISALRGALLGAGSEAMAAAAALDPGPIDLPGPTGEMNRLRLHPRGRVLCLGPSSGAVLAQAIQALRLGNSVLAISATASQTLAPLLGSDFPITALDGVMAPEALTTLPIDLVASCAVPGRIRSALAERDGPIIPLITDRIDPAAYGCERAVCIDTTASGGNATLLAKAAEA
ncbi:MAG: aldehyde dehydrogenase family protein, partial [Pseudomonadota bacterium]